MKKMFLNQKAVALVAVAASALMTLPAHAAGEGVIDVGGVVSAIQATSGPIGLIGAAVLLVIVAIAAFKWVRRAIS